MDEVVQQAFAHIDVIGPHVVEGHYDLVGPNGEIILPSMWEQLVEPGWSVTMHMWPIAAPKPPPVRGQGHKMTHADAPPGATVYPGNREKDSARRRTVPVNEPDPVASDSRSTKKPVWPYLSQRPRPSRSSRPGLPALLQVRPTHRRTGSSSSSSSGSVDVNTLERAFEKKLLVVIRTPNTPTVGSGMQHAATKKSAGKALPSPEQLDFVAARVSYEGPVGFDRASLELQQHLDQRPLDKRSDQWDTGHMTWM
jgi:hypothetical protein